MTWNVFWRWGGDYLERAPGIVDTLRACRPDIIGLCETWAGDDLPHDQRGGPPPTALVTTLAHPRGPLHVIVTCLEWEPSYAADQLAQASVVATLAADPRLDGPLPVLVLGDLNAAPGQAEIAPLTSALSDTFAAGGGDPGAKTLDSAVPFAPIEAAHLIDRRIDHILARPAVRVSRAFLAGDRPVAGRYPSDHYAVGVDLDL
ncbi:endonuclease/exonuclease/phosphatase family protein [Actinoplanes sp. NPDC051513]|uniref:endonuclease/exonuclease/phosphatase family protein n=1 Tax=Actinoplanes sp. NPDC051513 TaxID=3363908 RepID=UPI0037ADE9AC